MSIPRPQRRRLRAWLAAPAALALVLALAMAVLGTPAEASKGPGDRTAVSGVTVKKFVLRDASGAVISRGATATLAGHPAVRPFPKRQGTIRVATARTGHAVVVRHVRPAPRPVPATAYR